MSEKPNRDFTTMELAFCIHEYLDFPGVKKKLNAGKNYYINNKLFDL